MSKSLRNLSMAFAAMVLASPMLAADVQAKESFMATCSAKYKAAQASGAPEGTLKWTEFMKTQCAANAATAAPAAPAGAKSAKAATITPKTPSGSFMADCSAAWKDMKAKKTVPAGMTWKAFVASKCIAPAGATAAPTTSAAATGGTFMQQCSSAWKAMKDAGTIPAGLSWKQFVSNKCVTTAASTAPAPIAAKKKSAVAANGMDATPVEPTDGNQTPLATVDKNGKAFTPGQMAAHQRARDCGAKWRANKATFQAQYGTWPKYWSACNAELKAQGQ
ncbi:MAG: hypothetical protein KGO94_04325 [Alphaproteobacteria bacterium]|nr:hypothetical protein [Alphaproteobacteria bacterium]